MKTKEEIIIELMYSVIIDNDLIHLLFIDLSGAGLSQEEFNSIIEDISHK